MHLLIEKVMVTDAPVSPPGAGIQLRAIVRAVLIVIFLLMLAGCSKVPLATEPVGSGEIESIAGTIADHWKNPPSVRASGNGRISRSNSMIRFSFAILYDTPSWVRMDARPTAAITGPIGNLHFQLDGICAEAYLPHVPLWIKGCSGDEWPGLDDIDMPALILGFLTPQTLLSIGNPEVGVDQDLTVIKGRLGKGTVAFSLTSDLRELRRAEIVADDEGYHITINYEGHGWKGGIPAPRTTTLVYDSRDTRPEELRLLFTRFKRDASVDRDAHRIAVPVGLGPVDWNELKLWR